MIWYGMAVALIWYDMVWLIWYGCSPILCREFTESAMKSIVCIIWNNSLQVLLCAFKKKISFVQPKKRPDQKSLTAYYAWKKLDNVIL